MTEVLLHPSTNTQRSRRRRGGHNSRQVPGAPLAKSSSSPSHSSLLPPSRQRAAVYSLTHNNSGDDFTFPWPRIIITRRHELTLQ